MDVCIRTMLMLCSVTTDDVRSRHSKPSRKEYSNIKKERKGYLDLR